MKGRAAALALASLASQGCGIPFELAPGGAENVCASTSDCGSEAVCIYGTCVSTKADLDGLVLEVRPSSGGFGAGTSHLVSLGALLQGTSPGGQSASLDVPLASLVSIAPGLVVPKPELVACGAALDGSLPAKVELRAISPYAGLPAVTYTVETAPLLDGGGPAVASNPFTLELPAGDYDMYVTPLAAPGCEGGVPPPIFLRRQLLSEDIAGGGAFNLDLPPPDRLEVELTVPIDGPFEGWSLELVEPVGGRLVSKPVALDAPAGGTVLASIDYYWIDKSSPPLIRLRPTAPGAPTVYWQLDKVDLDGDMKVALTVADLLVTPIHIVARVLDETDGEPVAAVVTIQSTELSGVAAKNAAYEVMAETSSDGFFEVDLVPGSYRLVARPVAEQEQAIAVDTWAIKAGDLCCGRTLELPPLTRLEGALVSPAGAPITEATIAASPSLPEPSQYLVRALDPAFWPRQATTLSDASGAFALGIDPGSFDLSVRPYAASKLPWLVRSRITIDPGSTVSTLETMTVRYPALLGGRVLDPEGRPIGLAAIRGWLPVRSADGTAAGTVIQIAETTTDGQGGYTLLLPPSITAD